MDATEDITNDHVEVEFQQISKYPHPNFTVRRLPNNKREWHFVMVGDSRYISTAGYFHGRIILPHDYPNAPPQRILMYTAMLLPVEELGIPHAWDPHKCSVSSLLSDLFNYSIKSAQEKEPTQYRKTDDHTILMRYVTTLAYNCENPVFRILFPDYVKKYEKQFKRFYEEERRRWHYGWRLYVFIVVWFFVMIIGLAFAIAVLSS